MTWYETLDFEDNPFTVNPKRYTDCLVNMDEVIEETIYRINAGSLLVAIAKDGNGKTSLLMKAAEVFGGKGKVAYVDCEALDRKLNITSVLKGKYGFWGRLMNKTPRNMILLLDNVQNLSKVNNERIKYYFDQGYIKSIIFTTTSLGRAKFSDSLKDRIGERVIKLKPITEEDAVELIYNRIGDSDLLNEELIKEIFKISNQNPKTLLENCELLAEHAVSKKRKRIQQADLEEVLGVKNV